jgi:hypothetical protein
MPSHMDQKAAETNGVRGSTVEKTASINGDWKIDAKSLHSFRAKNA